MSFITYLPTVVLVLPIFFTVWILIGIVVHNVHRGIWEKIDIVDVAPGRGPISWALAIMRSITGLRANMRDGFERFSKFNKPFALPSMWMGEAVIVLPPSMLHLLNRPRDELSTFHGLLESIHFRFTLSDRDVWSNPIHMEVVRRYLTQKGTGSLAGVTAEEWDAALRTWWGDSERGRTVNAWDSMSHIIAQVSARIMVGLPGCRDPAYVKESTLYASALLREACLISCLPPTIRQLTAPLLGLRVRYRQQRLLKVLLPMVEDRLQQSRREKRRDDDQTNVIAWLIRVSEEHGPEQANAHKIAMRMLALTSMFVFGTAWVFIYAVLDTYCDPSFEQIVGTLQSECRRTLAEHDGFATNEAVNSLHGLDSVVRESMRLNDSMVHLFPLNLISGESIDLGKDLRVDAGSNIRMVFPTQMIHRNPSVYSNPEQFDAFRFSRPFDDAAGTTTPRLENKRELATTVSASYLPFGYGRHVCPGRWLVVQTVKQGLAHVLLGYRVEVTKRPGLKRSLLHYMLPPFEAEVHVTRTP